MIYDPQYSIHQHSAHKSAIRNTTTHEIRNGKAKSRRIASGAIINVLRGAANGTRKWQAGKAKEPQYRGKCPNSPRFQEERPQWSWSLNWAAIGSSLGAAVPVGYCTGVMNSPAEVSTL